MPFPESQRVVYKNNPLAEVICQLRFPTILEIGSEDPAGFQKRIRSRYPLYARDEPGARMPREISEIVAQLRLPIGTERTTHKFLTEDSNRFVSLANDFIAVTEKQYSRWEHFRDEIGVAQAALEQVYQPSFYSRVGLRYQDIIDKTKLGLGSEPWESLVSPSIIGVLGAPEVGGRVQEIRTEARIALDEVAGGFVTLRHGLVESSPNGGQAYRIDADFFTQERSDAEHVLGILDTFNRLAGNLFRWAISARLRDALEPLEI